MTTGQAATPITHEMVFSAKVIWYDRIKGYGFLAVDRYPDDLLVHYTEVHRAGLGRSYLLKNDELKCRVGHHNGRACATDIVSVKLVDL